MKTLAASLIIMWTFLAVFMLIYDNSHGNFICYSCWMETQELQTNKQSNE